MSKEHNTKVSEAKKILPALDDFFQELLKEFHDSSFLERRNLPSYGGIYVFYQDEKPIYVGRANNIKKRIHGHTRPSSGHNSANFAFNLARLELAEKLAETKIGREELMQNSEFLEKFTKFKKDLHASKIKCLQIKNDAIQTIFEPYLSMKLDTYPVNNTFENH